MVKILKQARESETCDDGQLGMNGNQCARLLAYVTGLVNQELLLQNEYLAAENRVLRAHLPARLRLWDPERCTLELLCRPKGGLNQKCYFVTTA
jgi:hypothetical protein